MYLTAHRLLLPYTEERIALPAAVSARLLALFLHHPVITAHTHRIHHHLCLLCTPTPLCSSPALLSVSLPSPLFLPYSALLSSDPP